MLAWLLFFTLLKKLLDKVRRRFLQNYPDYNKKTGQSQSFVILTF